MINALLKHVVKDFNRTFRVPSVRIGPKSTQREMERGYSVLFGIYFVVLQKKKQKKKKHYIHLSAYRKIFIRDEISL